MRVIINLPDSLASMAEIYALKRKISLPQLIIAVLGKEIAGGDDSQEGIPSRSSLLPKLPNNGRAPYSLTSEYIDALLTPQS